MSFRYRDTQTGHFVTKSTWKRSKRAGGKRYKRERVKRKQFYANVLIEVGYNSHTNGNGYVFTIAIQRKRKESEAHLVDRISHLLGKGYFDKWAANFEETDFQWASFLNYSRIQSVKPGKFSRAAELLDFDRI